MDERNHLTASAGQATGPAVPARPARQFTQLVQDSLHVLRTCPLAAKLIVSSAIISVPCYLTKMFLQQRLIELGWPTEALFLPLLLGGIACVLGTELAAGSGSAPCGGSTPSVPCSAVRAPFWWAPRQPGAASSA